MVNRRVYRESAKAIAEGTARYCCGALNEKAVEDDDYWEATQTFKNMFSPYNMELGQHYWWGFQTTEESQLARSLALLFMAEMAQDEIAK